MGTLANSEDPDAAFHLDLHSLLRRNRSSEKEIHYFGEIITCVPHYIQETIRTLLYVAL